MPPSAQRGTSVEVTLSGQKLEGTRGLLLRYSAFPDQITPVDRGLKAEVSASTDGQVKAKITIPADAPSGLHEVRALTAQGVTTATYFYVSQYAQVAEKEPNNRPAQANPIQWPVTLAGVINGNEDQDCYSFSAKKGEWMSFDLEGFKRYAPPQNNQQGISYLDAFLVLRDPSGRELATDDDSTRLDSFLAYQFPADGTYSISVRDSIYRGRGDFHYRLTIGKQPVVTALFPPGGPKGSRLIATVFGYNLDPSGATSIRTSVNLQSQPGVQEFRLTTGAGTSNPVPVVSGQADEASEVEPNEKVSNATPVVVPIVACGKFDSATDVDAFRFQAQGGQRMVFQIQASRLGSPADTSLTLMNRSGQVIGRDDDGGGMPDARLEVQIPTTDEYVIFVRNQVRSVYGAQCFYRLDIRPLQPRFNVVFRQEGVDNQGNTTQVPIDSVALQQGGSVDFELQLNRAEGQTGDVPLSLNLPPTVKGLKLESLTRTQIPKKQGEGGPPEFRTTVDKTPPMVKNGQGTVLLRLTCEPDMPVGSYLNLYLRVAGTAGAQPYVVNKPLWVTVSPK